MLRQMLIYLPLLALLILSACSQPSDAAQGCPAPTGDAELLTREDHGYCVLYPSGYSVEQPNNSETVLVVGSLLNVEEPRAYIEVDEADDRTAEEIADALVAELESAVPDIPIERTELTIDGERAVVLDGVPGQDISRQVVVVRGGRLYILTFVPADESLGDIYTRMKNLYDTVVGSLSFLPAE